MPNPRTMLSALLSHALFGFFYRFDGWLARTDSIPLTWKTTDPWTAQSNGNAGNADTNSASPAGWMCCLMGKWKNNLIAPATYGDSVNQTIKVMDNAIVTRLYHRASRRSIYDLVSLFEIMNTPRTNQILAILLESDGELTEENAAGILVNLCRELETESADAIRLLRSSRNCMNDEQEGVDMICGKIDHFLANERGLATAPKNSDC